ncbi:hypothetical protein LOK49_LG04G01975 [Camellia lanceoleosa]|uniref:Uncharacterized protein n=1 Tax=Camellia lanceoleosa TaxID=1840588 RepID=A0ACC0I4M9_9ERIC|nr:hypothetical protein LOK49_LG04G01975 [Camellia lanceoleosa]
MKKFYELIEDPKRRFLVLLMMSKYYPYLQIRDSCQMELSRIFLYLSNKWWFGWRRAFVGEYKYLGFTLQGQPAVLLEEGVVFSSMNCVGPG